MRNERSLHHGRDKEHQRHPANSSPSHEEWSSHSVLFLLQTLKKCSKNDALCQPFSATNLSRKPLIVNSLASETARARPPTSASLIVGSAKLAVPTCTAVAPTARYSSTSSTDSMPPRPKIGILTAFRVSQTRRSVMGLIAGPDRPPVRFPSLDFP